MKTSSKLFENCLQFRYCNCVANKNLLIHGKHFQRLPILKPSSLGTYLINIWAGFYVTVWDHPYITSAHFWTFLNPFLNHPLTTTG